MTVRRRLVLFVGGFDPRGARHYHQLFKQECRKQSAVSGVAYDVGPRQRTADGHSRWTVQASDSQTAVSGPVGDGTETCVEFFDWTDIVRRHWPRSTFAVIVQSWKTYALAMRSARWLSPLLKAAPYTLLTFAYPLLFALVLLLVAGLGAWAAMVGLEQVGVSSGGQLAGALLVVLAFGAAGWWLEQQMHVTWLLRIFNFAAARSDEPELGQRLQQKAERLRDALQADRWDEVLLVGFSVGSVLGLQLADSVAELCTDQPELTRRLSLVTLGNCIPLFALMPQAHGLRATLERVAQARDLYWADISSPGDSVSFAMADVVGLSMRGQTGMPSDTGAVAVNPRAMRSPRFHKLFHPRSYALIRRNKMRMHMQYLMAGELVGGYDYFELVAGSRPLHQYVKEKLIR